MYTFSVLSYYVNKHGYRPRPWNEEVAAGVACGCSDCGDDCEREPVAYVHTADPKHSIAICEHAADQLSIITDCLDIEEYDYEPTLSYHDVISNMFGEKENGKEVRMSFRRLKKRYQSGRLSFAPLTSQGFVSLRGRNVKAISNAANTAATWLLASERLVKTLSRSTSGFPFFNF